MDLHGGVGSMHAVRIGWLTGWSPPLPGCPTAGSTKRSWNKTVPAFRILVRESCCPRPADAMGATEGPSVAWEELPLEDE